MAKKSILESWIELRWPFKGINVTSAYSDQEAATTPDCLNVRPFDPATGQMRGAKRAGTKKYFDTQVNGSASIQDIDKVVTTYGLASVEGPGQIVTQNTPNAFKLASIAGTVYFSSSPTGTLQASTWDSSGYLYTAIDTGSGFKVYKFTPAGTQLWSTTIANVVAFGGVAADQNFLFVLLKVAGPAMQLFRLAVDDGAIEDGGPWKATGVGAGDLSGNEPANGAGVGSYGSSLAIIEGASESYLGVNGIDTSTGYKFDVFQLSDGAKVGTVSVADVSPETTGDTASGGSCFYFLTKARTSGQKLVKVDTGANLIWQVGTSGGLESVCVDPLTGRIAVCGNEGDLGTGKSFALVSATTGALSSISTPGTLPDWALVRPSGNGGFTLFTSSSVIAMGLTQALGTSWGPTTVSAATLGQGNSVNITGARTAAELASSRRVRGLTVAGGSIYRFSPAGAVLVSGGSAALNSANQIVFGTQFGQQFFYTDGRSFVVYDAATDAVTTWTASAGTLPTDGPTLICTWHGRIVLAAAWSWYMSAVDAPLDWDYSPDLISETQATSGNNAPAGQIGDKINALIPFNDDILIFGGDHTIWQMTGDPMAGGRVDLVSDITGIAYGRAFCRDPLGNLYFFGSRGGVFRFAPGTGVSRISQRIDESLATLNMATTIVRMVWDDREQGFYLFLTPTTSTTATTNYFYDSRTESWLPDQFFNTNHNPKAVFVFDGDDPDDRVTLMGSWDGYIRQFCRTADHIDDDGEAVVAHVLIGPIKDKGQSALMIQEMQGTLSAGSDQVNWSILKGRSAEGAALASAAASGSFGAGRNNTDLVMVSGNDLFLKLTNDAVGERFAVEHLQILTRAFGSGQQRAL